MDQVSDINMPVQKKAGENLSDTGVSHSKKWDFTTVINLVILLVFPYFLSSSVDAFLSNIEYLDLCINDLSKGFIFVFEGLSYSPLKITIYCLFVIAVFIGLNYVMKRQGRDAVRQIISVLQSFMMLLILLFITVVTTSFQLIRGKMQ